jgi:hypothetical protein
MFAGIMLSVDEKIKLNRWGMFMIMVPYKSVAAALVLTIIFGPLGLFYSSFLGGVVMSIFGLVAIGTMASMRSPLPMVTVYLFCMLWAMAAVRSYNHTMLKIAVSGCLHKPAKKRSNFFRRKKHDKTPYIPEESASEVTESEDNASWKL